jgi:hypothetical protein
MSRDRSELRDISVVNLQLTRKLERKWNEWAKRANVLPWEDVKSRRKPRPVAADLKPIKIKVNR